MLLIGRRHGHGDMDCVTDRLAPMDRALNSNVKCVVDRLAPLDRHSDVKCVTARSAPWMR